MVGYALDNLVKQGVVAARQPGGPGAAPASASWSSAGAPHPDISTAAALREALLRPSSVAYSDSASGVYIETEMFKKLGIAEQMQGKAT